jgi:hypothetical protein
VKRQASPISAAGNIQFEDILKVEQRVFGGRQGTSAGGSGTLVIFLGTGLCLMLINFHQYPYNFIFT